MYVIIISLWLSWVSLIKNSSSKSHKYPRIILFKNCQLSFSSCRPYGGFLIPIVTRFFSPKEIFTMPHPMTWRRFLRRISFWPSVDSFMITLLKKEKEMLGSPSSGRSELPIRWNMVFSLSCQKWIRYLGTACTFYDHDRQHTPAGINNVSQKPRMV